jgi:2-methylcitrate dehydratase PrpD
MERRNRVDIASDYVDYARGSRFKDLPPKVVDYAKILILDTLGVIIAGSSAKGIGTFADLLKDWGGKPESTVFIYGDKVPAAKPLGERKASALIKAVRNLETVSDVSQLVDYLR